MDEQVLDDLIFGLVDPATKFTWTEVGEESGAADFPNDKIWEDRPW